MRGGPALGLGLGVVAAHAVAFTLLAARCHGTELSVEIAPAQAAAQLALDGTTPPELADRVEIDDTDAPAGPGLVRRRWVVRYRGGFERAVYAAQLVGPFQDPAARACTGRITVAQSLLDKIAAELAAALDKELAGENILGAGKFERVTDVTLRWAGPPIWPWDIGFIGAAPHGFVRVELRVEFTRIAIPLTIALVPQPATTELKFRIAASASLDFNNGVAQWVSDKLGGDKLATRIARDHIDGALLSALAPPPPFALPGGNELRFTYCNEPAEIVDGVSGSLPFAVALGRAGDPSILPPRIGRAPRQSSTAPLSIDLDLDALNAVLYELWRTGVLDAELAKAGLDARFNEDPVVAEFLTLRLAPLRLALPPVITTSSRGLRLHADARVAITDRDTTTTGHVWGGLEFTVGPDRHVSAPPKRGTDVDALAPLEVDLGVLDLTCERAANVRVPCYADLVSAIRGRGSEFHGALTRAFTSLLADIFVERRLAATGLPAELVIRRAVPRITRAGNNASLQLGLDAELVRVP
ncbi:MAG: hypothetical protein SFX73_25840 [Kofleriaceae bacterium]|nr:hypothetical protein [Kofleriaceae bacterium]